MRAGIGTRPRRAAAPHGAGEQALRYVAVGASGYLVGMLLYASVIGLGASAYAAVPPAFIANGVWNFALNRRWCFPASGLPLRVEAGRACVVAGASLVANYSVLYLLHGRAHVPAITAQALTIVLVTPVGFFGNRHWSFDAA